VQFLGDRQGFARICSEISLELVGKIGTVLVWGFVGPNTILAREVVSGILEGLLDFLERAIWSVELGQSLRNFGFCHRA
jgi:hypothetical protein